MIDKVELGRHMCCNVPHHFISKQNDLDPKRIYDLELNMHICFTVEVAKY